MKTNPFHVFSLLRALRVFVVTLLFICGPALAANRPIEKQWDIRTGPNKTMQIEWFAGESVQFDLEPLNGREALDLTGAMVVWDVLDWDVPTNAYVSATGTVSSASASWTLTAEQANLPEGTYRGYARAFDGEEIMVLAYQTIKVSWSPASGNYDLVDAHDVYYSRGEIDALLAALQAAIDLKQDAATAATDAELTAATNTLNAAINLKQDAATAATDAELTAATNTLNAAIALKQDAATAATDADLSAATNTLNAAIALKQDAATAATDAELNTATNTLNAAIALKQDAATAATDAELNTATNTLNAAINLKQDAATAATDAELNTATNTLNAAIALKQDASTAATDAELNAATNTLNAAIALKQDAATAATDAELNTATNTLNAAINLKQDASTAATDAELLATSNTLAAATSAVAESVVNLSYVVNPSLWGLSINGDLEPMGVSAGLLDDGLFAIDLSTGDLMITGNQSTRFWQVSGSDIYPEVN